MILTALYIALYIIVSMITFLLIIAYLMMSGKFHEMHPRWMFPLVIIGGPIMWAVCLGILIDGIKKSLTS